MTRDPSSFPVPGPATARRALLLGAPAMAGVVYASNRLVEIPINDWLTWGAFTYPFAFLVTDLVNRRSGPALAMRVVWVGFALGVVLSLVYADPRIAVASGTAFLASQALDIRVFDALRARRWWIAPGTSSTLGSILDSVLFWSIAFAGTDVPWVQLGLGDFCVKLAMALAVLVPYRLLAGAGARRSDPLPR